MDDYMNLSREEVHAFLEQSLADLEALRGEQMARRRKEKEKNDGRL